MKETCKIFTVIVYFSAVLLLFQIAGRERRGGGAQERPQVRTVWGHSDLTRSEVTVTSGKSGVTVTSGKRSEVTVASGKRSGLR